MDVRVTGSNHFIEALSVQEADDPTGAYHCQTCGREYLSLDELEAVERKPLGKIIFYESEEEKEYITEGEFIRDFSDELYYHGSESARAVVYDNSHLSLKFQLLNVRLKQYGKRQLNYEEFLQPEPVFYDEEEDYEE